VSQNEREARRERLEELRAAGVDPYPARVGPREPIAAICERFGARDAESLEAEPQLVGVAGRVVALRSFGKLIFATLLENGSRIQISGRKSEIEPELFDFVKRMDVGDFVRVEGPVWRTKKGELTVDVRKAELLAKGLRPLPEKWHGLTDVETRFRQRYLDILVNEDARRIAVLRSRIVTAMRSFLDGRDFLEVETPVLQPLYGGAIARPFSTHHNTYDQLLYLRISDELYLKRLVVAGIDRVYEIGRVFRNEGISRKHNPEFTMMECYQAYADYRDVMELTQSMIQQIAERVLGGTRVEFQGHSIDLAGDWPRVRLCDAIQRETGIDILAHEDLASLRGAVRAADLAVDDAPTWGKLVDALFSECVELKSRIIPWRSRRWPSARPRTRGSSSASRPSWPAWKSPTPSASSTIRTISAAGSRRHAPIGRPGTRRRTRSTRTSCRLWRWGCRRPAGSASASIGL
jgi:lysyl-tRNA synthetase class 2